MGRPLEVTGLIMSGYVLTSRKTVSLLKEEMATSLEQHADKPDVILSIVRMMRLVNDLDTTTLNQLAIVEKKFAGINLADELRRLANEINGGNDV